MLVKLCPFFDILFYPYIRISCDKAGIRNILIIIRVSSYFLRRSYWVGILLWKLLQSAGVIKHPNNEVFSFIIQICVGMLTYVGVLAH